MSPVIKSTGPLAVIFGNTQKRMSSCIWNTPIEDRHCEYCTYKGCEVKPDPFEVGRRYIDVMSGIIGCDILVRCRHQDVVWARRIVSYQLRKEGFSTTIIGKIMRMDHTSILVAENKVSDMLCYPKMYPEEICLWKKFQNCIISQ